MFWNQLKHSVSEIYSPRTPEGKGRLITLTSGMVAAFYNVFITGIFYTGFLSMYDISITGVGIVTFIPYIASCFSLFSPRILGRYQRRKWILLGSKIYFYAMYIIATTLMPLFVTDPDQRLLWFVILLFLAYGVYALFSPGFTTWFYNFYPAENDSRTRFFKYNQVFSSVLSCLMLLGSSILTDAVEGSAMQNQLILIFRYFAFVLVLVDVGLQAMAKEYPYAEVPKLQFKKVFTIPFGYKKFMLCMAVMFIWNYLNNLNNGIWNFHLLNNLGFSYTVINAVGMMSTIWLLCTVGVWQRLLHRFSWIKTFGIACVAFAPTEFLMFSLTPGDEGMWAIASVVQQICSVGFNLAYANILYLNLPREESTACISFNTIGCNLFAFLGMITGTLVSSIGGEGTISFLGRELFAVQFTTLMRCIFLVSLGLWMAISWRKFTPDDDIERIDSLKRRKVAQ